MCWILIPSNVSPGCAWADRYSRSGSQAELRFYLRPTPGSKPASDFLMTSRHIVQHRLPRITFSVPDFVPKAKVE